MQLTNAQEKLVKSLQTKKGRRESGLCLIEGQKVLDSVGDYIEFTFNRDEVKNFDKLVTTETPQEIAGVAKIPQWSLEEIQSKKTIVVLDGVQDPGNVGTILRLCLGFDASLILIQSADPTSPKVVRSSAGALFSVQWMEIDRDNAIDFISGLKRNIYRLEKRQGAKGLKVTEFDDKIILVAGSEGSGIALGLDGQSMFIEHNSKLESLNVASALAIALYNR
ncbi:RNA methyltransferase [Patescibacteria group bacterium]|nr:RNA methyltransferase [Patescibacteria group bacterium]MBU4453269.1 RNA methyltransferase [Patescibacteria group bacterium]MCG2687189.1 RNA methyltransferase [Candidatus Parcubacteria bacterium]